MSLDKGIITIAIGKKYATQAKYLAFSAILRASHIRRAVITDFPEMLKEYYDIIIPYDKEYDPFLMKTRMNIFTPFEETLYLDADSLIMNRIDSYWESLRNRHFAYRGIKRTNGEWYFDIEKASELFHIPWVAQLNSGMFMFDKSETANNIFDTAYDYMKNRKDLGVAFFRDKMLPDEPFFAIAIAKNNVEPYEDYGRFSRAPIGATDIHVDVIRGVSYFRSAHGDYVHPLVVHFCGRFGQLLFIFQKLKLYLHFKSNEIGANILKNIAGKENETNIF